MILQTSRPRTMRRSSTNGVTDEIPNKISCHLSITGSDIRQLDETHLPNGSSDADCAATLEKKTMTATTTITPYLFFGGRCEEALNYYTKALGGEIKMLMRFNESPAPPPPGMLQAGFETKIMHADFFVKGIHMMASDGCNEADGGKCEGFKLALGVPTEAEARAAFEALAQGGNVEMPLTPTFWSPCFGMLTDQFGIQWMVMVPGPNR